MAKSSITENIRVNNPAVLVEYVKAMERHAKENHIRTEDEKSGVVMDKERTRLLVEKVLSKHSSTR